MLKSCQYCGRIHQKNYDCGKRPKIRGKYTDKDKFRSSRKWRDKREQIRQRDMNICQVCYRKLYNTARQYNHEDLSVHHAIPLEEDYERRLDDDNLITLCGMHHEMAEAGLIPYAVIKQIIAEQERQQGYPPGG